MAGIDPNAVVRKLALKLAQTQIDLAMAEVALETATSTAASKPTVDDSVRPGE
jgi:hypothetical protein